MLLDREMVDIGDGHGRRQLLDRVRPGDTAAVVLPGLGGGNGYRQTGIVVSPLQIEVIIPARGTERVVPL